MTAPKTGTRGEVLTSALRLLSVEVPTQHLEGQIMPELYTHLMRIQFYWEQENAWGIQGLFSMVSLIQFT